MGRPKKYTTEEEQIAAKRASRQQYNHKLRSLQPSATALAEPSLTSPPACRKIRRAGKITAVESFKRVNLTVYIYRDND